MELKLAKDEVIIKSWDYASQGKWYTKDKLIANFTLTNKRVISTMENKITLNRTEVPLSAIKTVSAKYGARRTFWPKVQAVFGGILCVVIIGIPILKNALRKIRSATFDLILETRYSDFEGKPFTLGANAALDALKKRSRLGGMIRSILGAIPIIGMAFRSKNPNEIPVSVKKDIAKEIINEIGAAIMDLNAQA